jgi:hypothetical protein
MVIEYCPVLKGASGFSAMPDPGGEPLELCEECGSPLEEGSCRNCRPGFRDGSSPVGAAPLDRRELSRVLGRSVGARAHGSYSLSMRQEERMAPLRKEIELLVERFSAPPEVKASVKQNSEHLAVKIVDELGPTKAAIASVAQEFLRLGRNLVEVSSCISQVHPGMDRWRDLVVEVYPAPSGEVHVLVDGRDRPFRSYYSGLYLKLRIPLFTTDGGALVELRNARLTGDGYDPRRVEPLRPTEFIIKTDDRNFELFKVLKEAQLSGKAGGTPADLGAMFRKYSISKLPLTERLLRESGLLQQVNTEYAKAYAQKVRNGRGRTPRKLAEEAVIGACEDVVPECLSNSISQKYHLKQSGMSSLVVKSELAAWQG